MSAVGAHDAVNRQRRIQPRRQGRYLNSYFTGLLLRALLRAHADVRHRQRPDVFLGEPRRIFRDGRRQLPLAEITGITDHLKRLGSGRARKSSQHDRNQEHSRDSASSCAP